MNINIITNIIIVTEKNADAATTMTIKSIIMTMTTKKAADAATTMTIKSIIMTMTTKKAADAATIMTTKNVIIVMTMANMYRDIRKVVSVRNVIHMHNTVIYVEKAWLIVSAKCLMKILKNKYI